MSKKINYEIVGDFDDSQKNIHIKCLNSIHSLIYSNDNIDIDFLKKIIIKNKKIISCSFYWVWGDYKAKWSASFGYDREVHYTVWEQVSYTGSDHKTYYKKEPVTKTKIVTDWKPANGNDDGDFKEHCYSGSFFEKDTPIFFETLNLPVKGDKFDPKKYDLIDEYFYTENQIISRVNSAVGGKIQNQVINNNAQGDRHKDWRVNYNLTNIKTAKVSFPIAVSDLEFNKKKYKLIYTVDEKNILGIFSHQELPVSLTQEKESEQLHLSRYKGIYLFLPFFLLFFNESIQNRGIAGIGIGWAVFLSLLYACYVWLYYKQLIADKLKLYQDTISKILLERIDKL
jgi:hypothetical protein